MSASKSPSYDELKRRLEAAESALKAIREGRVDTILGERETLVVRLAEAEAREAHLKQVLLAIRNVNQLIVAEDDPQRLIEQACVNLTETMGYHNAWIALLGGEVAQGLGLPTEEPVAAAAAAGFDGGFEILREHFDRGEFPDCMARAMESEDVFVVGDPAADCPDCPLHGQYGGRSGLVRRLEADGMTYGILTASVPAAYARDDEEQDLFNEVAGDLSFALYKIAAARELKDAHRRYRDLFEKHSAAKLIIDPEDGRIVDANSAAAGFYGWNRNELCRMRISDINMLTPAQVKTEMENARKLKRTHFEFKHRRADRSVRDVAVYSSKVEANGKELLYSIVQDITDRKQAEQALKESESYQRTILQTTADGFWVIDGKGRIIEVNRAYCKMTGYSRDEIIGLSIGDLDAVETPAETVRRIGCIMQAGHKIFETEHRRKDGSVFPVEVSTTYIKERGGQFVCFCRDLTERKRAGEKLRAAEETYRNVFLNAQVGMFRTDIKTGLILDANDAVARFVGYRNRGEMLAAPFRIAERYVNPCDREKMTALLKAHGEVSDFEAPFRRNDGSAIIMRFSARLVPEKGWIEGVSVDVTKERQAEEALNREHMMLVRTEALAHVGSWEWEAEGDKVTWSEELFRIFGLDPREDAPPFAEHQAFYVPEDRARLVKAVEECLQNGVPYDLEVCVTRTDGQLRHCIVRGIPEHGADGSVNRLYGSLHDITEIKRAKERIAILGHMLDEAPVSITIHDAEGRFLYANHKTVALHGYASLDEFLKIHLHELDVPESKALLAERFRKIDEAGEARFDVAHYRKDGSIFPLEVLAKQIEWEGRPAVLSIAADITERKQAEQSLVQSEKKYRDIFDNSSDCIFIHDASTGAIVDVNRTTCETFGYSIEEIKQLEVGDFSLNRPPYTSAEAAAWLSKAHMEGPQRFEWLAKTRKGRLIWFENYLLHALIGGKDMILVFGRNIDDRKMVEQALRRREELLNQAQEIAQLGSYVWSIGDDSLEWSRQMYAIAGIDPGRFYENLQETVSNLIHPDDRDGVNEQVGQMVEQKRTWPMEFRLVRPDGGVRWLRSTSRFEYDSRGEPVLCVGVHHDITEKKQREAEYEKLETQLHQTQKMEAVGRLAGGVAHDFNNMLGVILGYADVILTEMDPDQPFYADLTEIRKAGERSADLTRQLLAFARRQTVAPKVIDLNRTVEGMLKMLRRLIGEDIDLSWQPGYGRMPVFMDPSQLDQILANLCVNTRDAISGVGKLTIETGCVSFDMEYCTDHAGFIPGDFIMLAVSDDGCGMDNETMDNIFEPFFTTKGVGKGTGLGLSTVFGIVKQNNGFINVYSEPGKGTTFRIYLPPHEGADAGVKTKETTEIPTGRGETVLVVEDEASILKLTKRMLQQLGYKVLTASTTGEALTLAEKHTTGIHLLITDVVMPEMNGRELTEKLQAHYPALRVLFMSGYTANVIAHRGVLDEGVNFIQKPFSNRDLAVKVREALGHSWPDSCRGDR